MTTCIFCRAEIPPSSNLCPVCGFSSLLALPYHPSIQHYQRFLFLSLAGILLGLLACVLAYLQTAIPVFVPLLILSLTASGLTLEATLDQNDTLILKILSVSGIFLSALALLLIILLNSSINAPGSYF